MELVLNLKVINLSWEMVMSVASFTLEQYELHPRTIIRNATPSELYEEALTYEPDASISSVGALIVSSYEKTGRSPKDKRIVEYPSIDKYVWWGNINIGMDEATFMISRGRVCSKPLQPLFVNGIGPIEYQKWVWD